MEGTAPVQFVSPEGMAAVVFLTQVRSHFAQAPRLVGNLVKCQILDGIPPLLSGALCSTRYILVVFEQGQNVFLSKIPKLYS